MIGKRQRGARSRFVAPLFALLASLAGASAAYAGSTSAQIGYDDLAARLGAGNVPDGTDVVVAQIEAPDAQGDYAPNTTLSQFSHVTSWNFQSGATGESTHARQVAFRYYGSNLSFSTGISTVYLWEANHWLGAGQLRVVGAPSAVAPLTTPGSVKVMNHSWVGDAQSLAVNNDVLRRADVVADRDGILFCVGTGNTGQSAGPLLVNMFNALCVGRADGMHEHPDTAGSDSPGRMKPDIVAPGTLTSYTTGTVSSCMAILVDAARNHPNVSANLDTRTPDAMRAFVLAGASHDSAWTNNPDSSGPDRGRTDRPLDDVFGAGVINIDRAHLVLTAGEQDSSASAPTSANAQFNGWERRAYSIGDDRYWRFDVTALADEAVFAAAWNRLTNSTHSTSYVANIDLTLWRVDENDELQTLVGDDGLPYFDGGNVVSESAVDNVEYLRITNLQPGDYVLAASRVDNVVSLPTINVTVAWKFPDDLPVPVACPADISPRPDGDGQVTISDVLAVLTAFGLPCDECPEDISPQPDGDGAVTVADVTAALSAFGPCP